MLHRLLVIALVALSCLDVSSAASKWMQGDATFYPYIDAGSCGYGKLDKRMPTGRYIAAISDKVKGYKKMCGQCFQVMCDTRLVKDHFGASYHGSPRACKKKGKSIVVMVTDECTCAGNKKWCCDKKLSHLDVSVEAYKQLADISKSGVMSIKFRRVTCPGAKKRSTNRRKRRCSKSVGPWHQCGGIASSNKAWQKDAAWPGVCCPEFLSCKRKTKYYWSCKR